MNKEKVKKGTTNFFKDSELPNPEEFMKDRFVSMLEKLNHEIEIVVHQRPADTLPTKPHISTSTGNLRRNSVTGT